MMNIWKFKMLIIIVNSAFIDLPSPSTIIMKFPLFALYLFIFANEITADLFLAICCTWSTSHLYQYVNNLWIICSLHGDGGSMFFLSFIHVARSLPCEFHTVLELWTLESAYCFFNSQSVYVLPVAIGLNVLLRRNRFLKVCFSHSSHWH